MIDLHMHILPGMDDGPKDMAESLEMCRLAAQDGTRVVCATPHMFNGVYEVSRERILAGVQELRARIAEEKIDLEIVPGAEVYVHMELCQFLDKGLVLTPGDSGRYLLLELPSDILPPMLDRYLFTIQLAGVTPILAHPERNFEIQTDPSVLVQTVTSGSLLQITAGSLFGDFGSRAHKCAHKLLKMGMAHLVGSDAHHALGRIPGLEKSYRLVKRTLGKREAESVFYNRPSRILIGQRIEVPEIKTKQGIGLFRRFGRGGFHQP